MSHKRFFRSKIVFVSTGAAVENIYHTKVDPGMLRFYTRIAIENINSAMTELRVGVDSRGEFHQHIEQDSPSSATLYWIADPLYIYGSERLQARVTGATAGNRIEVNVQGYEISEDDLNA